MVKLNLGSEFRGTKIITSLNSSSGSMVKLARKQLIKKKKLRTAETVKQHKIQKVAELAQLPRMDKIHQSNAEQCFE